MRRLTPFKTTPTIALISAAFVLAACADNEAKTLLDTEKANAITHTIQTPAGDALGTIVLEDLGRAGTKVTINVAGISPGAHAMHFHEFGKCEAPDFKSSGGHYNPTTSSHGHKMPDGPHAGDMMNVDVAADGTGTFIVTNERVSIRGNHGLPALLDEDGTALILHGGADDYVSQPSGAAGPRIGCAVIED